MTCLLYTSCLAVYHARETGEGQVVETTLCGSAVAITEDKVITYGAEHEDPMRTGNAHPLINPYDILKCKDCLLYTSLAGVAILLPLARLVSLLIHPMTAVGAKQNPREQHHFIIAVGAFR